MKKILFFLLISYNSFAQDSSRAVITVNVQARDLLYLSNLTATDALFEDLDSVMKTKFRVSSPPSGTTTVQIPGIQVRAWWIVLLRLSYDPVAINTNIVSRLSSLLSGAGNNWLSHRITRETNIIIATQQLRMANGSARLQKQIDTQIID